MNRSILLGIFLCVLLCQSSIFSQNNKVNLNDNQVASILVRANKKVPLNENQRLAGELLITKENLVTGNNNIWTIVGSIVIYKVRIKKEEINQINQKEILEYIVYKDNTKKIETMIEFEEAILRTKSKKGVGSTLDTAINAIIDSIGPDDVTIIN